MLKKNGTIIRNALAAMRYVKEFSDYLLTHRKTLLFTLFIITVFFRIPSLYLEHESSRNDPGDDSLQSILGAESLEEGNGYNIKYIKRFHPNVDNELKPHLLYHFPPGYSLYIAGIFVINDASIQTQPLLAIQIANTITFAFSVMILYLLLESLMEQKIAIASIVLLVANPQLLIFSTSLLSETLYIFICVLSLYLIIGKKDYSNNKKMIGLSGFLGGLAFLVRYPGFLVVFSVILWYVLVKRKYINAFFYGSITFLTVLPWFLLCFFEYNDPLPRLHGTHSYPPAEIDTTQSLLFSQSSILNSMKLIDAFGTSLGSIELLYMLAPFLIIGIILLYMKHESLSLFSILFIVTFLFHSSGIGGGDIDRFMVLITFFGIPISVMTMKELINGASKVDILKVKINGERYFVFMVLAILFFTSIHSIHESLAPGNYKDKHDDEKYEWLINQTEGGEVIASTEPHRSYYFTRLDTVKLAENLDERWLGKFISTYNISYIVIEEQTFTHYDEGYLYTIFYENKTRPVGSQLYVESYTLTLIHLEDNYDNIIWFYRIGLNTEVQ